MNLTELKEKFNALSKPKKIILIFAIVVCIISAICQPKIETGYTRVAEKVCKSENKCVNYKMFEPIFVSEYSSDKFQVWNDKKESIGTIEKTNVVFEGTPEYEQTKQEKADIDKRDMERQAQLEEKQQKEKESKLAELEPVMKKAYYKIEIKQLSADGSGIYNFYVNPLVWAKLKYDEKQNAFKNCVTYAQLKTNASNANAIKYSTKIKSSSNAIVLAEYDTFKGIKVK